MRTKKITFLLLSILIPPMGNSLYSQEERDAIKFHLQNGETKQFSIGEVKNLTFPEKSLSVSFLTEKEKKQFELEQLLKITFEDSGISGIETISVKNRLKIYATPNPATEQIQIVGWEGNVPTPVCIYSTEGKLCLAIDWNGSSSINVSSLSPGLYIMKVSARQIKIFIK